MPASTDIKFYVHTNNNAPQLTNNYGCMIDVLDACLVNGFGAQSVSTLKATGKVVTVTFGNAHNLMQYQVIKIVGANQSEFNGEHRILSVPNATSFTYEIANTASVAQATGTIVCSLPPLGWEKPFSSTATTGSGGKGAYRSSNLLLASRPFLRVVDELDPAYTATYAKYAKVGIVEDMTDINTMLGVQAPYDSANPDKNWVGTGSGASAINGWSKWYYALHAAYNQSTTDSTVPSAAGREYMIVGNADYFYVLPSTSASVAALYGFGAFNSLLNVDNANTFLSACLTDRAANVSTFKAQYTGLGHTGSNGLCLLQRSYSQAATPKNAAHLSLDLRGNATVFSSGIQNYVGSKALASVSPFAPVFLNEDVLRGELPNFYWLFQDKPYNHLQLIEKNKNLFVAINAATHSVNNTIGQVVLKIGDL